MKAPAFDYVRVPTLSEALAVLREHGPDARVIAGGQSLVPALNLRLIAPSLLIDIGGLEELKGIKVADGTVRIGALTRHVDLLRSGDVVAHAPLLAEAVAHVSHPAIRNRGTIGGSLANADPASELPACVLALNGRVIATGEGSQRTIAAADFFTGTYQTALAPDEILTAVEVPAQKQNERSAFIELARRSGDYALVGLAAHATISGDEFEGLRLAFFAVGDRPTLAVRAAERLIGRLRPTALADAQEALTADLSPEGDLQVSAGMRLHLARVLLRRALALLHPHGRQAASERQSA